MRSYLKLLFLCALFLTGTAHVLAGPGDFNIDGTFEAAIDLPRILFLLQRDPNGPAIEVEDNFELNYAFLDTGASGILLSRETAEIMGIAIEPNATFVDVGVGGEEYFDVSEALYIGTTDYDSSDSYNQNEYIVSGPWRFQVNQNNALDPYDVLGIPVMAGKTVILKSAATNQPWFFSADIVEPNDPAIPEADFNVALRFERYITPEDVRNIPPLPVLAYNPVIDNIIAEHNDVNSVGSWLLDTGAMLSMMSVSQAVQLGLTDANGEPIITPDFTAALGGIGGSIEVPGFVIDNLIIPTLNGYDLIFNNAHIVVHDIGIFDLTTGEFIILDGIFGSNFFCASVNLATFNIAATPFDNITIDTQSAILGFDVSDIYYLPLSADLTGDRTVNFPDLDYLTDRWLQSDCNDNNNFCDGADINKSDTVDMVDYTILAGQWLYSANSVCGDAEHPWQQGDFNRDCSIDIHDLSILVEEWLADCNWLNWNCRGADLSLDNTVNFIDYADFGKNW